MNSRENLRIVLIAGGLAVGTVGGGSAIANYDNYIKVHEDVAKMGYNQARTPEVSAKVVEVDTRYYASLFVVAIGLLAATSTILIPEPTTSFSLPRRN